MRHKLPPQPLAFLGLMVSPVFLFHGILKGSGAQMGNKPSLSLETMAGGMLITP